jgi:DNA-binding transcriptional LysR family regulator
MAPIVERSDLIGILPRLFVEEISRNFDIVSYEPPVKISEQYLYILWHARNENDPGHKWLREQLLQAAKAAFPSTPSLRAKPGVRSLAVLQDRRRESSSRQSAT